MNRIILRSAETFFIIALWSACAVAGDSSSDTPVFKDKNLEKVARRFVFEKRDNDKPIVQADVVNLSTIQGGGMEITDLSGLDQCVNLASLDLARNKIKDLAPRTRQFAIVGDVGVHQKCGDAFWQQVSAGMTGLLKQGRFTEAVLDAIQKVGDVLARHFPRGSDGQNELPDGIVRD